MSHNKPFKIVVDKNMPAIGHLFSDLADIVALDGREINQSVLQNADALLCRSVTQVNQALLKNTNVSFVGTATIGTDHLDIDWLKQHNIAWSNAAGCNAAAVGQYVLSAISYWCQTHQKELLDVKVGVVGYGNVGKILAHYLQRLGISYCLCDPPLQEWQASQKSKHSEVEFVSMDAIYDCDVITLHVPLTQQVPHSTVHLIAQKQLQQLSTDQLIINASRGAVIDNQALLNYLLTNNPTASKITTAQFVLDVYEHEPNISRVLAEKCLLATPHIAGHTLEGKIRGSWMVYQAFCNHFNADIEQIESALYPDNNLLAAKDLTLAEEFLAIYDIKAQSDQFIHSVEPNIGQAFDQQRKNATKLANGQLRRDFSGWSASSKSNLLSLLKD